MPTTSVRRRISLFSRSSELLLQSCRQCSFGKLVKASRSVADAPPVVVKTVPQAGADDVDPAVTEVRVTFSKPMADKSWSWTTANDYGDFPNVTDATKLAYDKDGRTAVLPVKQEPGKTYAVWVNSDKFGNFKDADGRTAVPYLLVFQTKAK